tara:strand:- start:1505 stop:2710 length:1206 start_codon:yes stop_codon:yes gene_type:complete
MASTFKTLLNDDVVNTRTLLHESIPLTGTICSGTYQDINIKNFSHGMFQSVYDYPYLSSSANHVFDFTYGHSSDISSSIATAANKTGAQIQKKTNMYNQMAQMLIGYDETGAIRKFDSDGNGDSSDGTMHNCFFLNFSRLLVKDEIKKGSFRLAMYLSGSEAYVDPGDGVAGKGATSGTYQHEVTLGDYDALNEYRSSPSGDYGLIFKSQADSTTNTNSVGLIFYQAGIVVLTSSIISGHFVGPAGSNNDGTVADKYHAANHVINGGTPSGGGAKLEEGGGAGVGADTCVSHAITSGTIAQLADAFRFKVRSIDFNNTVELNSSIYFCRLNHNEFNYSANPTYVSGGKIAVKNNVNDLPVTYLTTVGLYSADNELLAVAKLSEPIRKDPNTELTLRVRLDY